MNKKILGLFILFPSFVYSCNATKYNVTIITNKFCTADNITSIKKDQNLSVGITPKTGYLLDNTCFKITCGSKDLTEKVDSWTYENEKLTIDKFYIDDSISIVANAYKEEKRCQVTIDEFDRNLIEPVEEFPKEIWNTDDLLIKFKVADGYGIDFDVKINKIKYENSELSFDNNSKIFTFKINKDDIVGEIKIKFIPIQGKLNLSKNKIDIKNYDTTNVTVFNPVGEIKIAKSESSFEVNKNNNVITFDSLSNNVCDNVVVTISDDVSSANVNVTVHHPKNQEEALDCTTLGFIRDNSEFEVTFDYDNSEDFETFTSHLEITENMYYDSGSGFTGYYYPGNKKTNKFVLKGINKHGRDYGYKHTSIESEYYRPVTSASYVINKASLDESASTLSIDKSDKTIKVYNSEELFWAVEHGYIPTFATTEKALLAKTIYEKGRKIVLEETRDSMSTFDELLQLFNYLENNIIYDFPSIDITEYREWVKYSSYFLEGVFIDGGLAVCDGFSKAYSFLCGLDSLPVIRSFGYCDDGKVRSGHAWNYAKLDDEWYLICPTWAIQNITRSISDIYKRNFSLYNFDCFLSSKYYFKDYGTPFSDDGFPFIVKSSYDYYSNIYKYLPFGNSKIYHFISNEYELTSLFNLCADVGLSKTKFGITFYFNGDDKYFVNLVEKALNNSRLEISEKALLGSSSSKVVYCVFR